MTKLEIVIDTDAKTKEVDIKIIDWNCNTSTNEEKLYKQFVYEQFVKYIDSVIKKNKNKKRKK